MRDWFLGQSQGVQYTIAIVGILLVIGIVGVAAGGGSSEENDSAATAETAHAEQEPAPAPAGEEVAEADPEPAATKPAPTKPAPKRPPLKERIRQQVIDANLNGEGDVVVVFVGTGRDRVATIQHELAENITEGTTQRGAEMDAQRIMGDIYSGPDAERFARVTVEAVAPLVDKFGNESTGPAFTVTLDGETGRQVNWDNIEQIDIRELWTIDLDLIE